MLLTRQHRCPGNSRRLSRVFGYGRRGEGPLVVLLHGFPESAWSWRQQIPVLARAGYRVVAPNQRGYDGSDAPPRIEDYEVRALVGDVVGLLDHYGEEQAVLVGHDWGALVAWHAALLRPERFRAIAALSVPWRGRPSGRPIPILRQIVGDRFFYILYFQEPGVAEAELEADVRRSLRLFYYWVSGEAPSELPSLVKPKTARLLDGIPEPEGLPPWLGEEDLDGYEADFEQSGKAAVVQTLLAIATSSGCAKKPSSPDATRSSSSTSTAPWTSSRSGGSCTTRCCFRERPATPSISRGIRLSVARAPIGGRTRRTVNRPRTTRRLARHSHSLYDVEAYQGGV